MSKSKKRKKARKPFVLKTCRALPHEVDMVFFDIDFFFRELSHGEIRVDEKGVPVLQSLNGEKYQTLPAIFGFMSVWRRISNHFNLGLDVEPVEKLCRRLETCMPVTPEEVEHCKAIIQTLRKAYSRLDLYEVKSIVNTELIALELSQPGASK